MIFLPSFGLEESGMEKSFPCHFDVRRNLFCFYTQILRYAQNDNKSKDFSATVEMTI